MYVLSCTRCPGRHLQVRGMRPAQAASRRGFADHDQVPPRAVSGDSPELPHRWRRFPVRRTARGRNRVCHQVRQPPGSSRHQSRAQGGKSRRHARDPGAYASSVAGRSPPDRDRVCRGETNTGNPRVDYHMSRSRMPLQWLPRACAQKLTLRARPLVPKGQLCNPRRYFRILGAVSRTKTRRQNQAPRRLQLTSPTRKKQRQAAHGASY